MQYNNGKGNVSINFNICDYTHRTCPDGYADYANMINENNTCNHLSSATLSEVTVSLIDEEVPDLGLKLLYKGGNRCNATNFYQLEVQLNCDEYASKVSYVLDTSSVKDPCSPRVILTSAESCPKLTLGTLWTFFNKYYYIFGVTMILGGIFLMVFGGRLYQVTMFLAGQISVAAFIMIIMFASVYPTNSPMWVVWLTLIVSIGMGSGVGYAAQKWARIGVLLIGTWIGGLFGALMYSMLFNAFAGNNPILTLWLSIAFCGVIIAVLSMIYFDHAVIFGSAIAGAYTFARVKYYTFYKLLYIGNLGIRRGFPK